MTVARLETDLPLVQSHKEDGYEQRRAALLVEAHRQPAVLTLVATDLSSLTEDWRHLYFFDKLSCWAQKFSI